MLFWMGEYDVFFEVFYNLKISQTKITFQNKRK